MGLNLIVKYSPPLPLFSTSMQHGWVAVNLQASGGSLDPAPAGGRHSACVSCISVTINESEALKQRVWGHWCQLAI